MFPVFQFLWHFLTMFPELPQFFPKVVHYERNFKDILNLLLRNISGTPLWLIFNFTGWEHCNHTAGETTKNSLNEPLGNITVTFFGKILNFPKIFPMGKSQSHDLEHCECTDHFLCWENCRKVGLENSEWTWGMLGGYWLSTLSISLWCIWNVLAEDTTPCPQWKR